MLSLVFAYVFNFGLLVSMYCVNNIIEKKLQKPTKNGSKCRRFVWFKFGGANIF